MKATYQPQVFLGLCAFFGSLGLSKGYDLHGAYFVLNHGPPLVTERLDPVISPGQNPSNHVHNIFGASSFSPTFDFAASQKATCNTHGVKADMSNYWFPALYFKNKNTGDYTMVPTQLETYYHFDPMNGKARTAFPPGFKMLGGNAMLRHNDTATDVGTASIRWYCHGPEKIGLGGFTTGFTSCPNYPGLSAELWMPFCWDGSMDFDPKNPSAHVAYGQGSDGTPVKQGGDCPSSHPTPLPQIFAEFHHDMSGLPAWGEDEQPFTLAQGDPTGFGMHMDFVSGWDVDTLQAAIDITSGTDTKCRIGESGDPLSDCFTILDQSVVKGCTISPVVSGDPPVNSPGTSLPGCNPPQTGPQDATIQTTCAGYKAPTVQTPAAGASSGAAGVSSAAAGASSAAAGPSATGGNSPAATGGSPPARGGMSPPTGGAPPGEQKDVVAPSTGSQPASTSAPSSPVESGSTTSSGSGANAIPSSVSVKDGHWTYQGCYSDLTPDRSIRTLSDSGPVNSGDTAATCATACAAAGYKIAGIEFGWQCFCDNKLNTSQSKKLDDGQCNMACAGSSQPCGGNGAIQVYAASGTTLTKRWPHVHRHIRDFTAA